MWEGGMIASYGILELNQIKSKQSSSYPNMPVPTFLVGHKDFFLSLNNFLLHPFLVLLPLTHNGKKTYIAWWASAWWPGGLTNAKPFYKTKKETFKTVLSLKKIKSLLEKAL